MLLCPVRSPCRITQHYWDRPEFYKPLGLAAHGGLDITGPKGKNVPTYAPFGGIVVFAGWDNNYGNHVRLRSFPNHSGISKEAVLGHHDSLVVVTGEEIAMGDQVGIMGKTGLADAIHIHLAHRNIDARGSVLNYNNGFKGYLPFGTKEEPEKYLIFWRYGSDMVSYPFG